MQRKQDHLGIKRVAVIKRVFDAQVKQLRLVFPMLFQELRMAKTAISHQARCLREIRQLVSATVFFYKLDQGQLDRLRHKQGVHAGGTKCVIQRPYRAGAAKQIKQTKHEGVVSGLPQGCIGKLRGDTTYLFPHLYRRRDAKRSRIRFGSRPSGAFVIFGGIINHKDWPGLCILILWCGGRFFLYGKPFCIHLRIPAHPPTHSDNMRPPIPGYSPTCDVLP